MQITLLYSQAATTQALVPAVILALGITREHRIGLYYYRILRSCLSALFVLPTYPTLLGLYKWTIRALRESVSLYLTIRSSFQALLAIAISVLGFLIGSVDAVIGES